MKNVYDILVNFKEKPYEFYEWDNTDSINHVKKIPSFKVNDLTIYEIMNYDVNMSREFLESILDKTEIFSDREIKKIPYACIVFNDEFALAIILDKSGRVVGKSKLLFDESDDVVISGKGLDIHNIEYSIIKKKKVNLKFTRKESKIVMLLEKYLNKILENKKYDELKYIYFECFDEEESEFINAYLKLKKSINDADFNVINRLKSLIKVLKK